MSENPERDHSKDEQQLREWAREQGQMAARVLAADAAPWLLQPPGWRSHLCSIGGLDMSFLASGSAAVAALAVLSFPGLHLTHLELLRLDALPAPYLPGFLAYREVPAYRELLRRAAAAGATPQLLLVDGYGLLHPRRCGSASHLGVLCDVPTVGVAKHLLHLPEAQLSERQLRATATAAAQAAAAALPDCSAASVRGTAAAGGADSWRPLKGGGGPDPSALWLPLADAAGDVVGAALSCTPAAACSSAADEGTQSALPLSSRPRAFRRPIYVSSGHRVSLAAALAIVRRCCLHRVPEPIRQADLLSRAEVRRWQQQLAAQAC